MSKLARAIFFVSLALLAGCLPVAPQAGKQAVITLSSTQEALSEAKTLVMPSVDPDREETMPATAESLPSAFDMNARLGRGINLGNALEAPSEGEWGVTLQEEYFRLIREQGFKSVRVPIRWPAHAQNQAPYTIDPQFFERVDWAVDQALKNDLLVILNIHHYDEFVADPPGQRERFLSIWEQVAARYQHAPVEVLFELLNEPNGGAMTAGLWNDLAAAALSKVRQTNPTRFVIIGPVDWNSIDRLEDLALPATDQRLIATFHYYQPFEFTHQGADWAPGADAWLGTQWQSSPAEEAAVRGDLDKAQRWSEAHNRPLLMGEFGAYSRAEMPSRARWTAFLAREAEKRGFSWAYWEFCSGFGIYDPDQKIFHQPLLQALIPAP